jgi:hypothetical protein
MRPVPASTAALPAGDAETAMQSSGASREAVRLERWRPKQRRGQFPSYSRPTPIRFNSGCVVMIFSRWSASSLRKKLTYLALLWPSSGLTAPSVLSASGGESPVDRFNFSLSSCGA